MKNLTTLLFALLIILFSAGSTILFAQDTGADPRVWSRVTIDPSATQWVKEHSNWTPAEPITRYFETADATVGPNYMVKPGNTTQSELSIDVHPTNSSIVFGSSNSTNWPVSTLYGTGVYWTLDGGSSWTGFDNPPFGTNGGDPASVIGPNGYFYEAYLTNSYALGVARSTNSGANWTTHIAYSTSNQDKEHLMADKTVTSPYVNRLYLPWSDLNQSNAALVYSTDFGTTWSAYKNLSVGLGGSFYQGPNAQTGPNGEVYVSYAIYDADWQDGEDAIGFSKSTDGGATWTAMRAYDQENFGIRGYLTAKSSIRCNSFPSMAVDRSGGPNNGNIYICWPQEDFTPAGSDPDIVLIKSTDGGATWSTPIRVNDDAMNNGKDQYFPWCTVDQVTGQLMLIFYDSRDVPNSQAEVFMATSFDGGNSFTNFKVSDQPHTPVPIGGLAGGYAGDYIGIAALDDIAYPFWMDNRLGSDHYQAWTASVTFGPPCPIDPPSNPNPPTGTTNIPITGNTATWTNGVGASQIEIWFGQVGSLTQVYSGAPITSISLAPFEPFQYMTTYAWQIKGKNDTCTVAGPMWTFTTIQDPNLVIETVDIYPQNSNYWTGTCNTSTKTQVSLVNAIEFEVGWMAFDTSPIVNDPSTAILDIEFNGYLYANAWPYWSITPMGTVNPITGTAAEINTQVSNNYQQGTAYSYNQESATLTNGWLTRTLETTAPADLKNALGQGWFAIGFTDWDFSTSYYVEFQGWAEANRPYLTVTYSYVIPVELTSFTANLNKDIVELSWITATETNNQGFEVQRSAGGEFETIAFVEGHGTTTEIQAYSYSDKKLDAGSYSYRLKQIDFDGTFTYSEEVNVEVKIPLEYALEQNYPNPFNPSTTIRYSIPEDGFVKLSVYNMLGEEVAMIVNNVQKAGRYEVNFNAASLSSGVYVYRIEAANYTASKKLMLMK